MLNLGFYHCQRFFPVCVGKQHRFVRSSDALIIACQEEEQQITVHRTLTFTTAAIIIDDDETDKQMLYFCRLQINNTSCASINNISNDRAVYTISSITWNG